MEFDQSLPKLSIMATRTAEATPCLWRTGAYTGFGYCKRAPTGKITLVFSDVQHSTALWEHSPKSMVKALHLHNSIFRDAILRHDGYEVKTEGDSFMVAFTNPLDAIRFCASVQEDLMLAAWPEDILTHPDGKEVKDEKTNSLVFRGLRVRMGVHTGKPLCQLDPVTGRMDYFGQMVNRAARISAVANGGQILVSDSCWEEIQYASDLANIGTFDCLGIFKLRDVSNELQIYQLLPRLCSFRRFVSLQFLATEKQDMIVKVTNEALESKVNKLYSDNISLKRQLLQLEDKISELSSSAGRLSQQLANITNCVAPSACNNQLKAQIAILAEVKILEQEFNAMLQKQEEMAGYLSRINRHEGKLSKQVSFITEEFSKMEDKSKEKDKVDDFSHLQKKMDILNDRLYKEISEKNKYERLWRECQHVQLFIEGKDEETTDKVVEMENQLLLACQYIDLLREGVSEAALPVPSCVDSYKAQSSGFVNIHV